MRDDLRDAELPQGWGFVTSLDRREFLKLASAGIVISFAVGPLVGRALGQRARGDRGGYPADPNAYLHVGADSRVTLLVGKIEMGQGVMTSLPQMVADELRVPLESIDIVMGDTDLCPWDMGTFGSLSTRHFGPFVRMAAAEARAILLQLGAERLEVPVSDVIADGGAVVVAKDRTRRVTYGALSAGKRIERKLDEEPELAAPSTFTVMGQSPPRRDAVEKVTGRAKYAGDIVPPGALHARILRPPAHGAVLASVDAKAAESVPGARVVRTGDLVAILHERRDQADKALALVKATFEPSASVLTDESIFDHLVKAAPESRTVASGGSVADGEKLAASSIDATYRKGYVAHAAMETHSAVASVEDGKVTVWAGTQTPFPLKSQLQRALGLPAEKVRVIVPYVGGGFGGKSASQQAIEAAKLAMATGRPVRVTWSREEEFFFDTFDPAAVIQIRSGLDAGGRIAFWDYVVFGAGDRGAEIFYDVPHHRTAARGAPMGGNPQGYHPFAVGPWRAPGANANAFARESHVDALASKAGVDPVEFRRKHLSDKRLLRCLDAAARQFGWTPKPAPSGRGFGVALGTDAGTAVANMAEVKVDEATGEIRVVRLVSAQDMGLVVNPEGARQQMEGCLTMGLGYALTEEVRFSKGEIGDTNFDTYELPRFSWMPRIETVLVDSPDLAPQGGGEPAIVPMGGVLANAVFDAVGARVRQLPMTPERVKAAMKG